MTSAIKRPARAAVLAAILATAVLLGVGAQAPAASAAQTVAPCWKLLLNDWYDGTIDKIYEIKCYRQAVEHLPTDAQLYSSAKDDILRAMGRAIQAQNEVTTPATPEPPPPTTTEPEPATTPVQTTPTTTPTTTEEEPTTTSEAVVPPPTTTSPGRPKPEGIPGALDKLNPGDADSFPLPLIILGALAIALVAAGVAGMIWRRMDRGDADPDTGAGPA